LQTVQVVAVVGATTYLELLHFTIFAPVVIPYTYILDVENPFSPQPEEYIASLKFHLINTC